MKTNRIPQRTLALLLFAALAAACSHDDFAAPGDNDAATPAPLGITVTDAGYASAEAPADPATRTVERGFATEFTAGDRIGLYAVELSEAGNPDSDRKFLYENLCLTHDGTTWTPPAGQELTHRPPEGGEIRYFAYYPYQAYYPNQGDDLTQLGDIASVNDARQFFISLIQSWTIENGPAYADYTASDLCVARGEITEGTAVDGFRLDFRMEHQMALAVIRLPTTKYTYTETVGGKPVEKSYRLYSGLNLPGWRENSSTVRCLANPFQKCEPFSGFYYDSELKRRTFQIPAASLEQKPGTYRTYTLDGGAESVTERVLRVGDYYMSDGTIVPNELIAEAMPASMRNDCIGVVYFVGEEEGLHESLSGYVRNDYLLWRDHPACTHGLVLALRNAADATPWSNTKEIVNEWTNVPERGEERVNIRGVNSFKGYSKTKALLAYNAAFPDKKVLAAAVANQYGVAPPEGCSGWFLPDLIDVNVMIRANFNTIEDALTTAGGDALGTASYWTSWENDADYAYTLLSDDLTFGEYYQKDSRHAVRPVLAF